jgi:predicted O-methyltransferase YrrM
LDLDRFERELPLLFEDFPTSPHPRGRRFDDIISRVPSIAEENNLALLNLAAGLLDPGECYVEIGTYLGASLIGAMRGNREHEFVAIDRFGFEPSDLSEWGRTSMPRSTRSALDRNLAAFQARRATILEGDAYEIVEGDGLEGRRVGVYFYDADHSYEGELRGLRMIEPWLADRAVLIADNTDGEVVARATADYVAGQPRARLLFALSGRGGGNPQWWGGVQAIAWEA